ncbi:tyrosine-type recombinase/integrase [Nafulsella turpanensis]|uniref:tyrosine-type recombinase/integrase n=1 Tax=Nafulsella turpanensis TaxID=1265690 RepID=UPI0009D94F74|nr:site-specific integrase [Nafulsella turpanensis]
METKMSLKFFLKEGKNNPERAKINLRIIVNRQKAEIATSCSIPLTDWDEHKQRSRTSQQVNMELNKLETKVLQLKNILEYEERPISARILMDMLTQKETLHSTLLAFYQKFIDHTSENPELSPETISLYKQTYGYVERFTKETYKAPDIPMKQLDYNFVIRLDQYLLKKGLKRNTVNKHHSRFRTLVNRAIYEGGLDKTPYQNFTLRNEKVDRKPLSKKELKLLTEHELGGNRSLQIVRDIFVFSCYTALRYQDGQDLEMKHIELRDNNQKFKKFICIKQHKTGGDLEIPILAPAQVIIDRYDNEERKITGKILPRFSNQKINAYLKVIADLVGIKKTLTHHVARHTCATTVLLANNVPLKVVSKWLGHSSIRQTEVYAKVYTDYMGEIADELEGKI